MSSLPSLFHSLLGNLIVWDLSSGSDEWAQKLVSSFRLFVHNESYPIVSLHLQNYIERPTETITRLSLEDGGKRLLHKSYGLSCR